MAGHKSFCRARAHLPATLSGAISCSAWRHQRAGLDLLARFGVEHLDAALAAHGRRLVVTDPGETADDLVWDMIEVLTLMCARLYGRRGGQPAAGQTGTAPPQGEAA
jgi:putative resolvase